MATKYYDKVIVPQNEINKKNIERLFSIVTSFDMSQIYNFTSEYNTSYNVTDNMGNSVLHVIIKIDDLNKTEDSRLHLIKYFIDNGVDIDVPDSNNVTPLHLACKKQYYKIAKYLIKNGAETNIEDSQMMTPLHYAIQGNTKICEKFREVRSLIDLPESKDVEKIEELTNVKKDLTTLLYQENSLNKYISHIVNTIKCTPDYDLKNSIKNQLNDLMNNILKKLADKTTSYDKTSQGIQIEIYNTTKSVTSKFNDIHKRSLNDVDFELIKDDETAWGIEGLNTKLLKPEEIEINKEKIVNQIVKINDNLDKGIENLKFQAKSIKNEPVSFLDTITKNRILAHYLIFSNNNINSVPQGAPRDDIIIATRNMINFEDQPADKKLMLELDDTIKHKFAVSLKDSIFNFETSSYVQGFYDYRIKRIQRFNINQGEVDHNLYFYNILAEILEVNLSNSGRAIIGSGNINQWFTRRRSPIQGTFENEAFLFMILNNCLRNSDLRTLQVEANLFMKNIPINPFLKCHFEDVCKNFTNINFVLISCINAYFRIICQQCNTSDNNFNRYMKVLYDCLENWNKNRNLNKVKFIVTSNSADIPANINQLIDILLSNSDTRLIKDIINNSFDNGINFNQFIKSINDFDGKTSFEEQTVNHVLKMLRNDKIKYCEETQIQKIEIVIEMIKYHFEKNENGLKDKIKLHNLINFLRNTRSVYSSFLNFDTLGLEIQEEELLAESTIQSMIALLGATLLIADPDDRDRIARNFRDPAIEDINPDEIESLIHFTVRSVSNDPFESILAFVIANVGGPHPYLQDLTDLYSVTNDLPFSLSKIYQQFFGVNQYGCNLIKEVLYQIQENPGINRRDLSSLINNICVANIMNLEYIGKTNVLERHNKFNIGNNQILAKGHRLLNPGQPNERIDGTFYLGEFVEIRNLLPDRIIANHPCFYNRAYNTMRVSDCTSYINSIQNHVKRQLKLIQNIVINQDSNNSATQILNDLLNEKFDNYQKVYNINLKYVTEAIHNLKNMTILKSVENQYISKSIENYKLKLSSLITLKNKTDTARNFLTFSNFETLSFKEIQNNNSELFNIFKEINAKKYLRAAINSVNNNIQLNQFYDGKISEDINNLVYHDDRNPGNTISYKGKMIKLNDFFNDNLTKFTTQGTIGLSNVQYQSSFLERASTSVTPIISDYLYLIKENLCKKMIEFIHQNKDQDSSVSKKIYDNVAEYIQKTKIYLEDQDKEAIILSLIGGLSNEVLGKYIQYIHTKYASALVEKSLKANLNVTDDKLTRSDMFKNMGMIKTRSDGSNKPFIIDYKENFTNSLEKPSSKLIEGFLQAVQRDRRFSPFRFTYDPIISQELQVNDQFYIYNNDYTSGILNDDSALCLEVDNNLLSLLIDNYCPINKRDKDGQSAIFYAIKNQHIDSLKKLLELEADYDSVPNKLNQTPIKYAIDLYNIHLDYLNDNSISQMIKKFYNQQFNITKSIVIDNPAYRNNFIKYTETGYGMLIGLINHWILYRNLDYNQNWNFNNKQNLFNLLEEKNLLTNNTISKYHILDTLNSPENVNNILEEREELHVVKYQIKEYQTNIDKLDRLIFNLNSSIDSLQEDMNSLSPIRRQKLQNKIDNQIGIRDEQIQIKNDYQAQLDRLERNINNLVIDNLTNLERIPLVFEIKNDILTQSVIQNYNRINFMIPSRPTKFDSHSYNKMWDIYLNDNQLLNNINNFHLLLVKLEKSILQDNDKNKKLNQLKIVNKFYDKLFLDFTEYLNKPKFTDSNKLLETAFDFIKHITKNILAEGFTMSVKDIIFEELRMAIPYDPIVHVTEETYFNLLFNMLDDIFNISTNVDGQIYELDDYIKNQINDTIVKNVLNIKANYKDVSPDDYEGVEEILKRVNEILRLNTKLVFTDDSKSLTYINKYLIPYYALNYKLIITNLKEIFDNYARFIVNNKRHLDVVIELLEA
jgi:ankyrin repeat protein